MLSITLSEFLGYLNVPALLPGKQYRQLKLQ
jgi:hypothetical protein